jgi:acyl-homoserine-lactone acylase
VAVRVWWQLSGTAFSDPFDPKQPLTTPNRLAASDDNVTAIGAAVKSLRDHKLPLDATMRQAQYALRHGRTVPIHGCSSGILTYSQSENPRSRHSGDQTSLFSRRKWVPIVFTRRQVARDPDLRRYMVGARR